MLIEITPTNMGRNGRMYEAWHKGELLCSSHTPFFSAARVLMERGEDPLEVLEMSRTGSTQVDMRAPLHVAALLTVYEADKAGPVIKEYVPFENPVFNEA